MRLQPTQQLLDGLAAIAHLAIKHTNILVSIGGSLKH